MKRTAPFIFLLALLATASGYLMSKVSWVGKVGITFFHKGYNLLKIWWQGAIAVFLVFLVLFLIHDFANRRLPGMTSRLLHIFILLLTITGFYFTYDDFSTDITHRLLGHHFHYGFYLIWVGWIMICLFFTFKKRSIVTNSGKNFPADQQSR
jgi:hypothetical protein